MAVQWPRLASGARPRSTSQSHAEQRKATQSDAEPRRRLRSSVFVAAAILAMNADSDLRARIERFVADLGSLNHAYPVSPSPERRKRYRAFYEAERKDLAKVEFKTLPRDGQIDLILLENRLRHELRELDIEEAEQKQIEPLIPFAPKIVALEERRRKMLPLDPSEAADGLDALAKEIGKLKDGLAQELQDGALAITDGVAKPPAKAKRSFSRAVANRAVRTLARLKEHFGKWFDFYHGYDPMFTWWCEAPYKAALTALDDYTGFVRERLVGIKPDDKTTIIGFPIGREALLAELESEMIPHTPEELVAIAEREYAWCEKEMKAACAALGYKDWREGLEHVKRQHVAPGEQPKLIRELAIEAIEFLEKKDLVTIPDLAKETWQMEMLSPEAQLQSPFFLGGDTILVSFPTNEMAHEAKLMSLRGNNRYFARATVQHELIPGHHLQGFMTERHRPYRRAFYTPFWTEGWALYWEMLLWDQGFPSTPEEKIGMLFWRMHRCVRIVFSLGFHLGDLTPQQCVDMLVERVGHERDNAFAEVRRSFAGNYGPLYQAAYMVGGLQFRALKAELVDAGKMPLKEFHDRILRLGPIPVALIRAELSGEGSMATRPKPWKF